MQMTGRCHANETGSGAGWPHPEPGREGGPSCTGEASWAFSHPCMGREGESVQTAGGVGVGRQGHHTGPLHRATAQGYHAGPPHGATTQGLGSERAVGRKGSVSRPAGVISTGRREVGECSGWEAERTEVGVTQAAWGQAGPQERGFGVSTPSACAVTACSGSCPLPQPPRCGWGTDTVLALTPALTPMFVLVWAPTASEPCGQQSVPTPAATPTPTAALTGNATRRQSGQTLTPMLRVTGMLTLVPC